MTDPLYCRTLGQGQDIFLIHGWGVHSGIWQAFADRLAASFRVTMVDLPGFGHSSLTGAIDDGSRLLAVAPANAIWLGWSMGGVIATYLAATEPTRIKALITLASSPYFMEETTWPGMSPALLENFASMLTQDYAATLERFLLLQCLGVPQPKQLVRTIQASLAQAPMPSTRALLSGLTLLKNLDARPLLSQITCPALHIFGRLDRLVPSKVADHLAQWGSKGTVEIISGAGHTPFLSHADLCIPMITQFCQQEAFDV